MSPYQLITCRVHIVAAGEIGCHLTLRLAIDSPALTDVLVLHWPANLKVTSEVDTHTFSPLTGDCKLTLSKQPTYCSSIRLNLTCYYYVWYVCCWIKVA